MRCTERSFLGSRGLVLASVVVAAASISACTSLRTGAGGGLGAAAEGGSRGRLVEELSIGSADGAAEYDLGYVADVALGPGGAILVADNTAGLVREYDANGRFVRSFGGKGGGRGQYISPQFLGVAPDGRVLVGDLPQSGARDAARIHVYSGEGAYLETWDFAHAIEGPLAFDESGVVYYPDSRSRAIERDELHAVFRCCGCPFVDERVSRPSIGDCHQVQAPHHISRRAAGRYRWRRSRHDHGANLRDRAASMG